jgi:hypothetical protein
MGVVKRVLCRQRLRKIPPQFNWIDHRLVRDRHIRGRSAQALALYLFLLTVADAEGLSFYSDASISRLLPLNGVELSRARQELLAAGLIAYAYPLYQVLALDPPEAARSGVSEPLLIGQILDQILERKTP